MKGALLKATDLEKTQSEGILQPCSFPSLSANVAQQSKYLQGSDPL